MRRCLLILVVLALVLASAALALGRWTRAVPMPHPRSAHAVVVARGSIYALGGPGTAVVDRFDGRRWRRETTLPGGVVNAPAAVALGASVYVLGGFAGATNEPSAALRIYDTRSRTWHSAAPLPGARGGHAAAVLGGKIHVVGGGNAVSTIADHSVDDPATNTWSAAAPLPRAEGSPAAVAFGGKLYAIGGRSGAADFGDVYVYDPARDAWSRGPSIPKRGTVGSAVYRGAIWVFGGESQARFRVLGDVFRLPAGASRWTRVSTLPTPRSYARAVVFRNAVYVVGGSTVAGDSHGARGSRLVDRFAAG
jgi:N-acetylneuraminic acid mutarotase